MNPGAGRCNSTKENFSPEEQGKMTPLADAQGPKASLHLEQESWQPNALELLSREPPVPLLLQMQSLSLELFCSLHQVKHKRHLRKSTSMTMH